MHEIGVFEAKNRLSALLDQVEQGEEITITRHGKPAAKLVPPDAGFNRGKAVAAAKRILARSEGVTLGGKLSLKALIDEGRR
jgi:prevent-host-death family protein